MSIEQTEEHNLAINLMKMQSDEGSIFDYIHHQIEAKEALIFRNISLCENLHHISELLHLKYSLLQESFSYLTSLEDPGLFRDLFRGYPKAL